MNLKHRITLKILSCVPDNYGGIETTVSKTKTFWATVSFVSAKDASTKSLGGSRSIDQEKRQALQKITVRQEFDLPEHCNLVWNQKSYHPISGLLQDVKTPGYAFFYVREITGGHHE